MESNTCQMIYIYMINHVCCLTDRSQTKYDVLNTSEKIFLTCLLYSMTQSSYLVWFGVTCHLPSATQLPPLIGIRHTMTSKNMEYLESAMETPVSDFWYAGNALAPTTNKYCGSHVSWWRHQMETFSELLAFCARNSPVTGEFPAQRPVARSFDVLFDLRLDKRLSKQS